MKKLLKIVGIVFVIGIVIGLLSQCDSSDDGTSVTTPAEGTTTEAEAELGTRDNPLPIGSTIESDDGWSITVNSVNLNATEAILAENPYNESPEDEYVYILVNITATFSGETTEGEYASASLAFVSVDGVTYNSYDTVLVAPDAFDSLTTLYNGGTITGNIAIAVPAADVESGTLAIIPSLLSDKFFVAVN